MTIITALLAALALTGLPALSDEFSDPASLSSWSSTTGEIQDGGRTTWQVANGELVVDVAQSSWVNDQHAFYLWKTVSGDFSVTTRIRPSGRHGAAPTGNWSLAGLLVRDPVEAGTTQEAWLGWTVGRVDHLPVFERKSTQRGGSQLVLVPAKPGWVELRVVRTGATFTLYRRYPGKAWIRQWRYERPDLGDTLQVGVDVQSGWHSHADLVAHVDWIRFADAT